MFCWESSVPVLALRCTKEILDSAGYKDQEVSLFNRVRWDDLFAIDFDDGPDPDVILAGLSWIDFLIVFIEVYLSHAPYVSRSSSAWVMPTP